MPPARASLLTPLLLLGCTAESPGVSVEYTLHLVPILPSNQDPFADLTRMEVEVDPALGTSTVLPMEVPGSGGTGVVDGLPEFTDAVVTVRGYAGDALIASGRTTTLSLADGDELEVPVLFAEVGRFGWLSPIESGVYAGEILALGDGRFRVFGGVGNTERGKIGVESDLIWEIDVATPTALPAFDEVGTLPEWTEVDGGATHTERAGFRMFGLTHGPHAGEHLMLGGSVNGICAPSTQVTDTAFYYDAESGAFTELDETMVDGRESFAAVLDARGNVVLQGGAVYDNRSSGCVVTTDIMRFDAEGESFDRVSGGADLGLVGTIAAQIGNDGALFCGGVQLDGDVGWRTTDTCEVVALDSDASVATDPLPDSIAGAAAVTLEDGRVLVTGGVHADDTVPFGIALDDSLDSGWLYDEGQWTPLTSTMDHPRAGHAMTLLPSGQVLIVGGASTWTPFQLSDAGYACAELFDPGTREFTPLSECSDDDAIGDLEDRTQVPLLAVDPEWGVLVAGGGKNAEAAQGTVALFVPSPE